MDLGADKAALAGVCSYLDASSLVTMQLVSKACREVATNDMVWKDVYERDFPYYADRLNRKSAGTNGSVSGRIPWYSEYKIRAHRELCWRTGRLTRPDPVILRGHAGTIFGATFLERPFRPGTIVTGAYLDTSFQGEIKMWLPSRGTTKENAAYHVDATAERVKVDAETEVTKSGVLSLYQLHGTPQIACTTFESGVHILRAEEQNIDDEEVLAEEDDEWKRDSLEKRQGYRGKKKRVQLTERVQSSPRHAMYRDDSDDEYTALSGAAKRSCLVEDHDDMRHEDHPSYSFRSVLEILGQRAPCTKTFVDKQSKILAIPSYDGAVRLYKLPEFISNPGSYDDSSYMTDNNGDDDSRPSQEARGPALEPSAVWLDDEELEIHEHGTTRREKHMPVSALTMSDDCQTMLTGGNDMQLKIWDMKQEVITNRLSGHDGWIWNVKSLDPFLHVAMSTATDGFCRQWDTRAGKCIGQINVSAHGPGDVYPVTGVALRGNGWHMAVGSLDKHVYALDCRMMKKMYTIGEHDDRVCRAMMHEDTLMTTGWDHSVRLWEFC